MYNGLVEGLFPWWFSERPREALKPSQPPGGGRGGAVLCWMQKPVDETQDHEHHCSIFLSTDWKVFAFPPEERNFLSSSLSYEIAHSIKKKKNRLMFQSQYCLFQVPDNFFWQMLFNRCRIKCVDDQGGRVDHGCLRVAHTSLCLADV